MQRQYMESAPLKEPIQPYAKYTAEFVGTFFLVLTVGCNVHVKSILAGLSIGGILMAMIYSFGSVSGGHFNPAVTLAVLLSGRDKITPAGAMWYMFSQVLGAICAAFLYRTLFNDAFLVHPSGAYSVGQAAACEIFLSGALCYVVLNVATCEESPPTSPNGFFGLAIGFTVVSSAISIGPISGCSLNPAVATGAVLASWAEHGGGQALHHYAKYIFAPFAGSLLGVILFFFVRGGVTETMEYREGNLVVFASNGGQGTMASQGIPAGYKADLLFCTFYKPGYAFAGWTQGFEGRGITYADGVNFSMPQDATTVYLHAQWREVARPRVAPPPVPDLPVMSHRDGCRSLQRGEATLFNELYEDHQMICGMRWVMKRRGGTSPVDVNITCLKYNNKGVFKHAIDSYNPVDALDGIYHISDAVTGLRRATEDDDCEVIKFQVDKMYDHTRSTSVLLITAGMMSASTTPATFADVDEFRLRVIDTVFEMQLCEYNKPTSTRHTDLLVVGMIYRRGSRWVFRPIDEAVSSDAGARVSAERGAFKKYVDQALTEHAAACAWDDWQASQS